jgi:hypothetical protein
MTDRDDLLMRELELAYPRHAGGADWDDVLNRAPAWMTERRSAFRSRRWIVIPAGVVIVSAVSVLLVAVLGGARSFTGDALAALGSGRWVHAEVQAMSPYTRVVDVRSGRERPIRVNVAFWYDTVSHREFSSTKLDGVAVGGLSTGIALDPGLAGFAGGYRVALQRGSSRIVGTTTVAGRPAKILRFATDGGASEEVAVDTGTHLPLWFRSLGNGSVGPIYRVRSISTLPARPTLPKGPKLSSYLGGASADVAQLTSSQAAVQLRGRFVWSGPRVGRLRLEAAHVQRVTTIRLLGRVPLHSGRGVILDYGAGREWLDISESREPAFVYDFTAYPGRPVLAADAPLPPVGELSLSCDSCGPGNHAVGDRPLWRAQLRSHGLYIRVRSTNRALTLSAARALRLLG